MVLVVPGATRAAAAKLAETIRGAVAARPIACDELRVPLTVSIGVAVHEPGGPFLSAGHLVRAADLAAYAAKHGGRTASAFSRPGPPPPNPPPRDTRKGVGFTYIGKAQDFPIPPGFVRFGKALQSPLKGRAG